jgi:hypothetical protein
MVAFTYTDHGPTRTAYVFANSRGSGAQVKFKPASMGLTGQVYIYNKWNGSGRIAASSDVFTDSVGDIAYYVAAEIGPSGIGFLGDAGMFVSLGRKRIAEVADDGSLRATVSFAAGEDSVTLQGHSPTAPEVVAQRGAAGPISYDPKSGLFIVMVSSDSDGTAAVTFSRPSADSSPGGLTAEYYGSANLTALKLIRIDPKVGFDPVARVCGASFFRYLRFLHQFVRKSQDVGRPASDCQ